MKKTLAALVLITASACASPPSRIAASYVSPLKYKDYTCDQIIMEMDHVGHRVTELYHSLKKTANNDKAAMGVGMILFFPALFMLEGGDGPEAAEYARMKGEYEALRQQAVMKNCNLEALPPSPDELIDRIED